MKKFKSLLLLSAMLLSFCCNISAKSKNAPSSNSSKGAVEVLTKADFITKVFDYESNSYEWKYKGSKPCIVDFYTDWCGPCKQIAPILKDLAMVYKNDIVIYKVNVDKEKELAAAFGIQSIPSLLFIPMKEKPQMVKGAMPKEAFIKQIDTFLLSK